MLAVYIDLNIDCAEDNCKSEKVTGYEHGIKIFRFKPLNKNIPIDLLGCTGAAYVGTKSDGKIIGNACEIKDGKILLPLTLQMTTDDITEILAEQEYRICLLELGVDENDIQTM